MSIASKVALLLVIAALPGSALGATAITNRPGDVPARNGVVAFYGYPGIYATDPKGSIPWLLVAGKRRACRRPSSATTAFCRIRSFAWSPDGTRLAFLHGNQDLSLYLVDADGHGERRVPGCGTPWASCDGFSWAPNSSSIVVGRAGRLVALGVDGSARRTLTTGLSDRWPVWSPDGSAIAFTRDVHKHPYLFTIRADGSAPSRIRGTGDAREPSWSPDSRTLVFSRPDGTYSVRLGVMQAVKLRSDAFGASFSPDGMSIAYSTVRELRPYVSRADRGEYRPEIWTMRPSGSRARRLYAGPAGSGGLLARPVWAPDGRRIAFADDAVYVMNADGTRLRRLSTLGQASFSIGTEVSWQSLPHPKPKPTPSLASPSFRVRSSLEGRTVLPHRIRWRATPSEAVRQVAFQVDGRMGWIAHEAPYTYAEDGYLVTSFLSPGPHRFTVRATSYDGVVATSSVVARIAAPPLPPAALAGNWQRTVDARDPPAQPGIEDPTFTPSGTYRLTFDRRWIRDGFPGTFVYPQSNRTGEGLVYLSDYTAGPHRIHVVGEVVFHPYSDRLAEGGAWCRFSGPPADYSWSVTGNTLTLAPVAGWDPCAIRGFVWTGTWTRVG